MFNKLILIPVVLILTSGCAFTVYDTPINYQYSGTPIRVDGVMPPLEIGQIADSRSISDKRMIVHQENQYGQTSSGGYLAEKELSLIVHDALTQGAEAAGLNGNANIVMTGELTNIEEDVIMGFMKTGLSVTTTVKLEIKKKTDNSIIWRDTFTGVGKNETVTGSMVQLVADTFKQSLNSMVEKVFKDQYFLQQIRESK